jgi:hypothetical protein
MEETGLTAEYELAGIYHEHAYQKETDELLEDKIFFVVRCTNVQGELIERFEGGRNQWATENEVADLRSFTSAKTEMDIAEGKVVFSEEIHRYSREDF